MSIEDLILILYNWLILRAYASSVINIMSKSRLNQQQQRRLQHRQARQITDGEQQSGLVVARYGKTVSVLTATQQQLTCHIRQHLPDLVAGDQVVWQTDEHGANRVVARLPRTCVLTRSNAKGKVKPIAANIDHIVIVFAPQPAPIEVLIDRYIVTAETLQITPTIVMNKSDLQPASQSSNLLALYADLGYPTCTVSCQQPESLSALHRCLQQRTSIVVGQSGVGKSSLLQQLLPGLDIAIGAVSTATQRGCHTTAVAQFYPLDNGGGIIDSPGIRELPLIHLSLTAVIQGFIELRAYQNQCQFRNCQHQREPGCAIGDAIATVMSPTRKQSILRILREIQY